MKYRKKLIHGLKILLAAGLLFVALFPFWCLILTAVRNSEEIKTSFSLLPKAPTFENFIELFSEKGFDTALKNSLINSVSALFISVLVGLSASYILARRRFRTGWKRPLTFWILLVRVLPPVAFVIPLYSMFSKMGILSTRIPIILSCVLINIPLIIWFMISFFRELPEEVEESGKIDGASEWQLYVRLVLPLVLPGLAAVSMLSFLYAWNEYTYSIILTRSPSNYTIPLALAVLNTEDNVTNFGLVAAGGVVSFLPVAVFVLFAQNYLISGLAGGAVKE